MFLSNRLQKFFVISSIKIVISSKSFDFRKSFVVVSLIRKSFTISTSTFINQFSINQRFAIVISRKSNATTSLTSDIETFILIRKSTIELITFFIISLTSITSSTFAIDILMRRFHRFQKLKNKNSRYQHEYRLTWLENMTSKRCCLFWLKQIVRNLSINLSTVRRKFVWRLSMIKFKMKTCLSSKNKSFVIITLQYIDWNFFVKLTIKFLTSFKILFLTDLIRLRNLRIEIKISMISHSDYVIKFFKCK